jgi:hypothetical protein
MSLTTLLRAIALFSTFFIALPVYAQQEDADGAPAVWQESAVKLPAAPAKENLLSFNPNASGNMKFAIDAKSLTVEKDEVVRYTLVITSAAGASNVSYEGIRCKTMEKKAYAFGQADNNWSVAKRDTWDAIADGRVNRQHITLAQDFFCDGSRVAGKAENIIERIRRNRPLK